MRRLRITIFLFLTAVSALAQRDSGKIAAEYFHLDDPRADSLTLFGEDFVKK